MLWVTSYYTFSEEEMRRGEKEGIGGGQFMALGRIVGWMCLNSGLCYLIYLPVA
jgi:hypothetical protein